MLNFFIGFAFFEAGAFFGFFVAALLNAAHAGQEISITVSYTHLDVYKRQEVGWRT